MNLLITGATGFIGGACVRAALARGHHVAGLIRKGSARANSAPRSDSITWIEGDLANPDWDALSAFKAETCLHTAWVTTPGEYLTAPANTDFLGWSATFLKRLSEMGMKHCVALGTCIEYAPQRNLLNEAISPVAPMNLYAQCKDELRRALELMEFDLCWARIFYPYGPGEDSRRLASSIIQRTLHDQEIVLKTPNSTKDYIYIDDVASALVRTVERRFRGIINVGTGVGVTIQKIAETIALIFGKAPRISTPESLADPYDWVVADNSRLSSLGWVQAHNIHSGLVALVDHLALTPYEATN